MIGDVTGSIVTSSTPSFSQSMVAVKVSSEPGSEKVADRSKSEPSTTIPPLIELTVGATLTTPIVSVRQSVASSSSATHSRTS